jgi:hypothetical protein
MNYLFFILYALSLRIMCVLQDQNPIFAGTHPMGNVSTVDFFNPLT